MQAFIEGQTTEKTYASLSHRDQSRIAIQKLRPMIGAFKYMQEKKIAKIFADQKNRIGAMIGHIDRNLHKTPRKFLPGRNSVRKEIVIGRPWQAQGLEDKWNAYMDNVFAVAKQRATDFMELHLKSLKTEWESTKKTNEFKDDVKDNQAKKDKKKELQQTQEDMLALIKKTRDEWEKVKDWKKPENWKAKREAGTEDDASAQKDQGEKEQG
jgi:hypothetical protein